jgi:hypothetical protein
VVAESAGLTRPEANTFQLYPNPAKNFITVQLNNNITGSAAVSISDMSGKVLKNLQINGTSNIPVNDIQSGCYMLKVTDANITRIGKIVIER